MSRTGNLLIDLHRWARRQDENFTTDSFAHLLGHLLTEDPPAAAKVLRRLTALDYSDEQWSAAQVETQVNTKYGTPDIRIAMPSATIFVEVKVEALLERAQPEAYLQALAELDDEETTTQLVVLTRYPAPDSIPAEVHRVRWFEIEEELDRIQGEVGSSTARFHIEQFRGFLDFRGMAILPVRSGVSSGIRKFQQENGHDAFLFRGKVKVLDVLLGTDELRPLHDLFMVMSKAIEHCGYSYSSLRLGSGARRGGWIGWNIDKLRYFFYIWLSSPEELVFQAYHPPIDPSKHDGRIGRVYEEDNGWRWDHTLDLASLDFDFFAASRESQLEVLMRFLDNCFDVARKLDC